VIKEPQNEIVVRLRAATPLRRDLIPAAEPSRRSSRAIQRERRRWLARRKLLVPLGHEDVEHQLFEEVAVNRLETILIIGKGANELLIVLRSLLRLKTRLEYKCSPGLFWTYWP
jgi:hypothetical protein